MKKYVGNCSDAFDWDQITQKLDEQQVSHKKYEEGSTASKEIDDVVSSLLAKSGIYGTKLLGAGG